MAGTVNKLPQSFLQIHDFYLNKKAFVARFTNAQDAEDYRKRHQHLDLAQIVRNAEGAGNEL